MYRRGGGPRWFTRGGSCASERRRRGLRHIVLGCSRSPPSPTAFAPRTRRCHLSRGPPFDRAMDRTASPDAVPARLRRRPLSQPRRSLRSACSAGRRRQRRATIRQSCRRPSPRTATGRATRFPTMTSHRRRRLASPRRGPAAGSSRRLPGSTRALGYRRMRTQRTPRVSPVRRPAAGA